MLRRRYRNEENPAWPGLVDLYAFTLIIFIVIALKIKNDMDAERSTLPAASLQQRIETLQARNDSLVAELEAEKEKVAQLLQELKSNRDDARAVLRQEARLAVIALRDSLSEMMEAGSEDLGPVHPNLPEFEIRRFGGHPVLFASGRYDLDEDAVNGVLALRNALARVLGSFPQAQIEVSGTADPNPYRSSGQIRDNVDLSAMRAATVAKLIKGKDESGQVISNPVVIVGLGEVGEFIEDPLLRQQIYREYRRVTLKIRIPIDSIQ